MYFIFEYYIAFLLLIAKITVTDQDLLWYKWEPEEAFNKQDKDVRGVVLTKSIDNRNNIEINKNLTELLSLISKTMSRSSNELRIQAIKKTPSHGASWTPHQSRHPQSINQSTVTHQLTHFLRPEISTPIFQSTLAYQETTSYHSHRLHQLTVLPQQATPSLQSIRHHIGTPYLKSTPCFQSTNIPRHTKNWKYLSTKATEAGKMNLQDQINVSYIDSPVRIVKNKNGFICLWFQSEILLDVSYKSWEGKTKVLKRAEIAFPVNESLAQGECFNNGSEARLKLESSKFGSIDLEFSKDDKIWFISSVIVNIKASQNPRFQHPTHSQIHISHNDLELFRTPLNKSFVCADEKTKRITSSLIITFKKMRIQPEPLHGNKFNQAVYCKKANRAVEIVIIVLTIACVIVFVLIAIYGSHLCRSRHANRRYDIQR